MTADGGVPTTGDPDPDQAWKALSLVNEWIRHAEAKTGVALTLAGVVGGVLYNLVKGQPHPSVMVSVLAFVCGLCAFLAGGCCVLAALPRLRLNSISPRKWKRETPDDWTNLLYYSHVARRYENDEPSYQEVIRALTSNPAELTSHIANQIHANSSVAHRKFNWVSRATGFLSASLISLGLLAGIIGGHF